MTNREYQEFCQSISRPIDKGFLNRLLGDKEVVEWIKEMLWLSRKADELKRKHFYTKFEGELSDKLERMSSKCLHGWLGIISEFEEFYGKPLTEELNSEEECGDVQWYVIELMSAFDLDFQEVLNKNKKKLSLRHKKGFNANNAEDRDIEAEQKVFE